MIVVKLRPLILEVSAIYLLVISGQDIRNEDCGERALNTFTAELNISTEVYGFFPPLQNCDYKQRFYFI